MPVKPVRTLGRFVFDGIEERLIVGSPGNTGDSFDALGEQFTGAQVPHTKSVLAEAGIVRGVCKQIIVIAHVEGAKPEKTVSFGVSDDNDLLAYSTDNTGFRQYTL